jgi:hypothetical protein
MPRLFVCDTEARITADIDADAPVLAEALEHANAEPVIRCAVLMALSALAEGGDWPHAALADMARFMGTMRDRLEQERLA